MGDLKKKTSDHIFRLPTGEEFLIEHEDREMSVHERTIARLKDYLEIFYRQQLVEIENEEKGKKKVARYRTYKNGIIGHRYRGYYIIKGEAKGLFQIWNEDKTIYKDNIYDYDECEWIIDKDTVNKEDIQLIKQLYGMEIYQLSALFVELMQKKEREGLNQKSTNLYKWVEKVRRRKAEGREF